MPLLASITSTEKASCDESTTARVTSEGGVLDVFDEFEDVRKTNEERCARLVAAAILAV